MDSIQQLKSMWEENKESYKKREIGSGVHSFISNVFESDKLFNLKKYALKKKGIGEFVQDTNGGKTGRPDFILYINNDIIIPCEAKCYTHIKDGEKQLLDYQIGWDKKYGILTDGYTWRFYNNTIFKELNIEQILNDPSLFKTFWKDYTNAENYYLSFFEKQGQLSLFDNEEILKVEENRLLFFEDITKLIANFKNKLNIEGYFLETDKKQRERKATEISYAYFIQFILFKTLVDNCYANYEQEFKDRIDTIYKSLKAETYNGILRRSWFFRQPGVVLKWIAVRFILLPAVPVECYSKPHRESCCQVPDGAVFYCTDQNTLQAPAWPRQLSSTL